MANEGGQRSEDIIKEFPRFFADCHLGKLAKYLRLMGFDTLYFNHISDDELIALAAAENRSVLTRDRLLSRRCENVQIVLLESTDTKKQIRQVLNAFHIGHLPSTFSRCIVCNTPLQPVDKEKIRHRLPAKIAAHFSFFEYCPVCDRIYWHGDHYRHMKEFIDSIGMN